MIYPPALDEPVTIELADIHECTRNPSKLRILLMLKKNGPMTAKQMLAGGIDVSQTTLYRLLNAMQEDGILSVVSETKVRALTEKTYDASDDLKNFDVDIVRNNDVREYCRLFSGFALDLVREFELYAERPDADITRDDCGFASVTVFMTGEEMERLSEDIYRLLEPYISRTFPDQDAHTFSIVLTPPRDGEAGFDEGWSRKGNLMRVVR